MYDRDLFLVPSARRAMGIVNVIGQVSGNDAYWFSRFPAMATRFGTTLLNPFAP